MLTMQRTVSYLVSPLPVTPTIPTVHHRRLWVTLDCSHYLRNNWALKWGITGTSHNPILVTLTDKQEWWSRTSPHITPALLGVASPTLEPPRRAPRTSGVWTYQHLPSPPATVSSFLGHITHSLRQGQPVLWCFSQLNKQLLTSSCTATRRPRPHPKLWEEQPSLAVCSWRQRLHLSHLPITSA